MCSWVLESSTNDDQCCTRATYSSSWEASARLGWLALAHSCRAGNSGTTTATRVDCRLDHTRKIVSGTGGKLEREKEGSGAGQNAPKKAEAGTAARLTGNSEAAAQECSKLVFGPP
jgi:hypothetical protein